MLSTEYKWQVNDTSSAILGALHPMSQYQLERMTSEDFARILSHGINHECATTTNRSGSPISIVTGVDDASALQQGNATGAA